MQNLTELIKISREAKKFLESEYRKTGTPQGRIANNLILREKRRRELENEYPAFENEEISTSTTP